MGSNETPMKGNTMTFKSAMSSLGNGLLTATTIIADSGVQAQITEIDTELQTLELKMEELRRQKSSLEARLITRY